MVKKFYVTTAIDYVNAKPHIGHAFEKVLADALVKWQILKGNKTFFLTGTDENAQKNAQAAELEGISPQKFVDKNSKFFIELCEKLNIQYNNFIRTTDPAHKKKAQEIFKKVYDKGEIYKGKYEGHYCVGCESFITEKELVDNKCPEHNKEPEWMSEEAYFFKLSKYKNKIIKFIENYIVPESRKKEILSRLKSDELKDLCVSRANLDWGIDSPIDKKFKIYVWFDALINYVSGSNKNWPADIHVIGKGINWFHSVIWPGMLMSAGYKLPKKLLVHGYLNLGGHKISKSLGNIIDPLELIEKYNSDIVRYSLLKCSVFEDSDYSEEILIKRNNNELANKLGNLISRTTALAEKYLTKKYIESDGKKHVENLKKIIIDKRWKKAELESNEDEENKEEEEGFLKLIQKSEKGIEGNLLTESPVPWINIVKEKVEEDLKNYELDKALNNIFAFIDHCNWYIQTKKPWETKDKKVLYELIDSIKAIAILLWPFIPETSEKIAKNLGFKIDFKEINKPIAIKKIKKSKILFKKI